MEGTDPAGTAPIPESERLPDMSEYVVGILRRVADRPAISEELAERIQEGHLAHLRRLHEIGELIAYGPFSEDTDVRGLLVFRRGPKDHVRELLAGDPQVSHGRLTVDLHLWSAAAGLRVGRPEPAGEEPVD